MDRAKFNIGKRVPHPFRRKVFPVERYTGRAFGDPVSLDQLGASSQFLHPSKEFRGGLFSSGDEDTDGLHLLVSLHRQEKAFQKAGRAAKEGDLPPLDSLCKGETIGGVWVKSDFKARENRQHSGKS